MGLIWSQPKPIKNATAIMIKASFPKNTKLKAQIWNLWKMYKNSLKQDGFSVRPYNNIWYVYYFTEITEDSYVKINYESKYMIDFKQKFAEWKEILDEFDCMEIIQPESDEGSWYFDMEIDQPVDDD